MQNVGGMSWEMSADTTDVLSADTTDVLSADTTDVLSADTRRQEQSGGNLGATWQHGGKEGPRADVGFYRETYAFLQHFH